MSCQPSWCIRCCRSSPSFVPGVLLSHRSRQKEKTKSQLKPMEHVLASSRGTHHVLAAHQGQSCGTSGVSNTGSQCWCSRESAPELLLVGMVGKEGMPSRAVGLWDGSCMRAPPSSGLSHPCGTQGRRETPRRTRACKKITATRLRVNKEEGQHTAQRPGFTPISLGGIRPTSFRCLHCK